MFRLAALAVTFILAGAGGLAVVGAALADDGAGASLSGCQGTAVSFDNDGNEKDSVAAPGDRGSSRSNPLHVASNGTVKWEGSSDAVITNLTWHVKLFGATVKTGHADNDDKKTADNGTESVDDYLPFKVTGLYHVDFDLSGEGGSCAGDMWVKLDGNPAGTIPWIAGVVLALGGLGGAWFSRPGSSAEGKRTHPVLGALSGLGLGLGLVLLMLVYGLAFAASWWPLAVILVLVIAGGVAWGMFGPAPGAAAEA